MSASDARSAPPAPSRQSPPAVQEGADLRLRLETGRLFGFVHTVEDVVYQRPGSDGIVPPRDWERNVAEQGRSMVELGLSFDVVHASPQVVDFAVGIDWVRAEQTLGGRTWRYDSRVPAGGSGELAGLGRIAGAHFLISVPAVGRARAYSIADLPPGLSRVEDEIGLDELTALLGASWLADLTDLAFGARSPLSAGRAGGVVPAGAGTSTPAAANGAALPRRVQVRDAWETRSGPWELVCSLENHDARQATIALHGAIAAGRILPVAGQEAQIVVTGGEQQGELVIDARTGMPRRMEIQRRIAMTVTLESGTVVDQLKVTRQLLDLRVQR